MNKVIGISVNISEQDEFHIYY